MSLWLVRHARPLIAPGICYGALDVPAEVAHTQQCAERLATALPPDIAVRCSPRQRCLQLAEALCQLRAGLTFEIDCRLAEMDFGSWEGQRWDEIGAAALHAWTDAFATHRPGGGESVQAFMCRVEAVWRQSTARAAPQAWITHAGVIRATSLLARGLRLPSRADQWPAEAPNYGEWKMQSLKHSTPERN